MTTVSAPQPATTATAPFREGQWVAENQDFQHPDIGRIKKVFWDDIAHEWVMNLVLYSPDGDRIGRKSPRRGGPSGFEPCVPCQSWALIRKPDFPLGRDRTGFRDWQSSLEYIKEAASAEPKAG